MPNLRQLRLAFASIALCACQMISGLDDLRLAEPDAATPPEPDADGGETANGTAGSSAAALPELVPCTADDGCGADELCVQGLCAARCEAEGDCEGSACHEITRATSAEGNARVCLRACDFASQEPCSAETQCARVDGVVEVSLLGNTGTLASPGLVPAASVCVAPSATCVTDQRCDEPAWGTRLCEAGSDAADCTCEPMIAGAPCDLLQQCGCSPGTHCALESIEASQAKLACVQDRPNARPPGSPCNEEDECGAGHSCWRGLCERYCASDADCGGGRCIPLEDGEPISGLGVCAIGCSFEPESGCADGARCVKAPQSEPYCLLPRDPCPFTDDGTCDEPDGEGTRICADGTDESDCASSTSD